MISGTKYHHGSSGVWAESRMHRRIMFKLGCKGRSGPGKEVAVLPSVSSSSIQTGSRRVAHLVGLFCMGLGLSPRLAQLFTNIPLPVLGE